VSIPARVRVRVRFIVSTAVIKEEDNCRRLERNHEKTPSTPRLSLVPISCVGLVGLNNERGGVWERIEERGFCILLNLVIRKKNNWGELKSF